jgi:hypothetical protein
MASTQVAPFWQGLEAHSLKFVDKKRRNNQQRKYK